MRHIKIKGLDAYDRVFENVKKYIESGGNVHLKYIFLSDNSDDKNIIAFIESASRINALSIEISADIYKPVNDKILEQMAKCMRLQKRMVLG